MIEVCPLKNETIRIITEDGLQLLIVYMTEVGKPVFEINSVLSGIGIKPVASNRMQLVMIDQSMPDHIAKKNQKLYKFTNTKEIDK